MNGILEAQTEAQNETTSNNYSRSHSAEKEKFYEEKNKDNYIRYALIGDPSRMYTVERIVGLRPRA